MKLHRKRGNAETGNDREYAGMMLKGWTGTRLENWITSQFYSIVAAEYPDGNFPQ